MRSFHLFSALVILTIGFGCANGESSKKTSPEKSNVAVANEFINAFYSFDRDSLRNVLSNAQSSHPNILYYQKWAECGNYEVLNKGALIHQSDSIITCPITVKDDLMSALDIDFNVTDTFHLKILDDKIVSIDNSSNDPDEYYKAKAWVKENHPALIDISCKDIWNGGPTPCECIQSTIRGFGLYMDQKNKK